MAVLLVCACGGTETHPFSQAHITVDSTKQMTALTAAERSSVCDEFSRALTASFDTPDVLCRFRALSSKPSCQADYSGCLAKPDLPKTISGCTSAMEGMWSCPITIGQYQDCFNDLNAQLLEVITTAPVCMPLTGPLPQTPASCLAAPCDYNWFAD
jgi:hypothetical protein